MGRSGFQLLQGLCARIEIVAFLRTYVSILAALFAIVAAVVALSDYWTETIAAEERLRQTGNAGFSVERYRWPKTGFKITLYAEPAMRLTYRIPDRNFEELRPARWLPGNRALLLELRFYLPMDSMGRDEGAILFYDFDRASLQTYTPYDALGGAAINEATAKKVKDGIFEAVHQLELELLERRQPSPTAR